MHNTAPIQPTLRQRRTLVQARRGLKELDFYIDPYVKNHYLNASEDEQRAFEALLEHEDPDLLLFFMEQQTPPAPLVAIVQKLKSLVHD